MSKINDQIVKYSSVEHKINVGLFISAGVGIAICFLLYEASGKFLDFLSVLVWVVLVALLLLGLAKVVVHYFYLDPLIQYMRQILLEGDPDPDFDYDKYEDWK